jgi:dienelactone hydrolase
MNNLLFKLLFSALIFLSFLTQPLHASEFVSLETRDGVKQNFRLLKDDKPVASVILFTGGKGKIGVNKWGIKKTGNFLVRSRKMFAKQGLMVAVVDAPSDMKGPMGMKGGFRDTEEHVKDIDAVIAYMRGQAAIPVWLIGTSRGTESAANVAIYSTQKPDGLVLTSSMSESNDKGRAVTEMVLENIKVPVLIVAHENDGCWVTPPEGAEEIRKMLKNAPKAEVKYFTGGKKAASKPCKAKSEHGFYGIEKEVVNYIANFVKSN